MYLTFDAWKDLLQERGLTSFAGVSTGARMAFIASQITFLTSRSRTLQDSYSTNSARPLPESRTRCFSPGRESQEEQAEAEWVGLRRGNTRGGGEEGQSVEEGQKASPSEEKESSPLC